MSVVVGERDGRCLACPPSRLQMAVVQAQVAHVFAELGLIPHQSQTDRHACFLGAEEPTREALPRRLTLFVAGLAGLAGLALGHRLIPARTPQRNGAVARFHGGLELSWRGEEGGREALTAVWNVERPPLSRRHRRYRGRQGFALSRVWRLLGQTQVRRQVDRQGTLSLWDRPVSVGVHAAGQTVTVCFDPITRRAVIRDAHDHVLREAPLPWLTKDWWWDPLSPTDQAAHCSDRSTCQ